MDPNFTIITVPSHSFEKKYKGMSVEAWDPVSSERMRRASLVPTRGTPLSRGRSLQVSVTPASVAPAVIDLPLGSSPAHATTFPRDDDSARARRHRRRYSEHPHVRRRDDSENRPATASAPAVPPVPAPLRPQRPAALDLHDVEEAFPTRGESSHAHRWADTPSAASVAAWVREQQVQAQYQFAPLSPPPNAATKAHPGLIGKMKKFIGKQKGE
ncbi:hypothetical protein K488DRAFT_87747 [Vararia minispora EC-137]|uniref:Uncharacterized protein n=1 Tax=Vararia minispora EC-137 TaxID=1314806 RepID=A0ACB8QF59_9AGAM|nr:hypothetical protein K488DRAFT_87747 [Vararia minispora EC-137]